MKLHTSGMTDCVLIETKLRPEQFHEQQLIGRPCSIYCKPGFVHEAVICKYMGIEVKGFL